MSNVSGVGVVGGAGGGGLAGSGANSGSKQVVGLGVVNERAGSQLGGNLGADHGSSGEGGVGGGGAGNGGSGSHLAGSVERKKKVRFLDDQ